MRQRRFLLLGALVLLAFLLRVWALDQVPPSLDPDEVSIGYNAYALLRTGRDEYGVRWPVSFRAFGEYKRPAYIYAAVPSIAVFGPTSFGVRFPAAVAGALSVAALYVVATLLLRDWIAGLAAAAFLAISPWHLQFTRAAREASLLVLAVLLLAAALLAAAHEARRRPRRAGSYATGAAGAFLLAVYSYPGATVLVPLLTLVLVRAYWRRLRLLPGRWVVAALAVLAVGALPLAAQFADGRARTRLSQVSIFGVEPLVTLSTSRIERDVQDGAPWLVNTPLVLGSRWAAGAYLSHFDPTYLFTNGDAEWRHHSVDNGQLYLWDAPLLLAGFLRLARTWRRPAMLGLGGWLLVGPLPAAFAEHAPHAVRSIGMLPAWYLLAATGLRPLWRWLSRRGLQRDWLVLLGLSAGFFGYMSYRYYPVEHAQSWQSGMLEGYRAAKAEVDAGHFQRVVLPQEMSLSYIYALYATQYDPRLYLAQGGSVADPDAPFYPSPGPLHFRPFEVRVVDWSTEPRSPDTLYVLEASNRPPPGLRVVKIVKDVAGQEKMQLLAYPRAGQAGES